MNIVRLQAEPINAESFAPFGNIISTDGPSFPINEGTTQRFHKLATVERHGGEAIISIFQAQPRSFPLRITMMERHPLGSQAFLPSDSHTYLVLVCLGEDAPDPTTLRLFEVTGKGVNYHAGVWHFPLLSLTDVRNFWIIDRAGDGINLQECNFSDDWEISIPSYGSNDQ